MADIETWMWEIRSAVDALVSGRGLDIHHPPDAALSQRVAGEGFPGVLPLWASRYYVVGLLARPQAEPRAWPAVILKDGQGLTLATDARTLLPQLVVNRMLSRAPEAAERLAGRWSEQRSRALALHRVLGGVDETLDVAVAAALDAAARTLFSSREGNKAAFEAAHSALSRRIDLSEPFVRYADWLDAGIAGRWTAPEEPARYGPWARRTVCWASNLAFSEPAMPKLPARSVHWLLEADAGIDSGLPGDATWAVRVGAASGEGTLSVAAEAMRDEPAPEDPVSEAILRALLNEGSDYRGLAHAEAVPALDERGEPERAWGALLSAAWWAARNVGQVPPAMIWGAQFLAGRRSWSDITWMIERAVGKA